MQINHLFILIFFWSRNVKSTYFCVHIFCNWIRISCCYCCWCFISWWLEHFSWVLHESCHSKLMDIFFSHIQHYLIHFASSRFVCFKKNLMKCCWNVMKMKAMMKDKNYFYANLRFVHNHRKYCSELHIL